jgi:hypothetical protein
MGFAKLVNDWEAPCRESPATIARRLRDEGIERAAAHAGPAWGERAYALLRAFIARYPKDTVFMIEDVRAFAKAQIEEPPDRRAWGAVAVRARRAGLIEKFGYQTHKDPVRHMGASMSWRIV